MSENKVISLDVVTGTGKDGDVKLERNSEPKTERPRERWQPGQVVIATTTDSQEALDHAANADLTGRERRSLKVPVADSNESDYRQADDGVQRVVSYQNRDQRHADLPRY